MSIISSDVDKIITALKKYKYVSLDELAEKSDVNRKTIEEWLPVLEDSNYIKIVYQFTKVYVKWLNEEEESVQTPGYDIGVQEDLSSNIMPEEELNKMRDNMETQVAEVSSVIDDKFKEVKEDETIDDLREKVETETKKIKDIEPEKDVDKEIHEEKEKTVVREKPRMKVVDEEVEAHKTDKIQHKPIKTVPTPNKEIQSSIENMLEHRTKKLSPYAEKLKDYLVDIDLAKKEIEELKGERKQLYADIYEPMEKEFKAGYTTIAEKIADKQKLILELQEKALKLPEKLEEVDRQQMKLHEIGEKVKYVADESTSIINESLGELDELSDAAAQQMRLAKKSINKGVSDLSEAQTLLKKIEDIEGDVNTKMVEVEGSVKDEQDRLETLAEVWREIQETKGDIVKGIKESSNIIDEEHQKLENIEEQMKNTDDLKEWIRMSQVVYNKKVDEFQEYVDKNDKDYNSLRESIEANYLKMYMKDLADLSKQYDATLSQAKGKEKNINDKIEDSKKKISDLIRQSQQIVEALEKGSPNNVNVDQLKQDIETRNLEKQNEIDEIVQQRKEIKETIKNKNKKKKKKQK